MRILLTTDTVGGVWTYCVELARALRRSDVKIALASMGEPLSADQRREIGALDHVTVFESSYKLEWMPDPWEDVAAAGRWLLDIEKRFAPDVVHLDGYAHGGLDWHAPVLIAAHSCVLSWWQAVKGEPAPQEWDRYHRVVKQGLRSAKLVVAPSAAMLQAIHTHYGPLPRSRVIANARDSSLFHPDGKLNFILSAGRLWDEAKNVAALARIAPKLAWPVAVAGDGGQSVQSEVRWLGRLTQFQMAGMLSRAPIYALPARYEPFGLSILEAALSGCALVLGDIPSLRENWTGAARFVDPADDGQLLQALNDLVADGEARKSLSAAAMSRAHRFTADRFAAEYLATYRELTDINFPHSSSIESHVERIAACGL